MRVICSISSQESELSKFRMRLWNFDVTYLYYLPWSFGNVVVLLCVQLWLKNSNFPLLATSRGRSAASKNSKQKLHTKSKKSAKLLLPTSSPPLVWLSLSRESISSSVDHHHSTDLYFQDLFLGLRRLAAEEGTFSKKTWLQKIKIRKLVSSLWARLPGYGQKRPRYQWVPGYPMVWDMENLV